MRILYLSQNDSIFEDNSPSRAQILEYAPIASLLFVVVASGFRRKSKKAEQIAQNVWIYRTNSIFKFMRIWDVYNLASFEASSKGVFQADLIIYEDEFVPSVSGLLLAKKFKRPLYGLLSETNEGPENLFHSKISLFALTSSDCIKVGSNEIKEKLLKKHPSLKIEVIKPFIGESILPTKSKAVIYGEKTGINLIRRQFPKFGFTAVAFVDTVDDIKFSLDILKQLNKRFPPSSLILLHSNNLEYKSVARNIDRDLEPFVGVKPIDDDQYEYMFSCNVFFGISSGEKYEEILSKACYVGATIIALPSEISEKMIDNNTTGFICPIATRQERVNYFTLKTFHLMENPETSLGFKINLPLSYKQRFSDTKEEYLKKLKLSLQECEEIYRKNHINYYNF